MNETILVALDAHLHNRPPGLSNLAYMSRIELWADMAVTEIRRLQGEVALRKEDEQALAAEVVRIRGVSRASPIEVAVALSLYGYNVSAAERAQRLWDHFQGDCAELYDLLGMMASSRVGFAATELAYPTAAVYVEHALDRYGDEAQERVRVNAGHCNGGTA